MPSSFKHRQKGKLVPRLTNPVRGSHFGELKVVSESEVNVLNSRWGLLEQTPAVVAIKVCEDSKKLLEQRCVNMSYMDVLWPLI